MQRFISNVCTKSVSVLTYCYLRTMLFTNSAFHWARRLVFTNLYLQVSKQEISLTEVGNVVFPSGKLGNSASTPTSDSEIWVSESNLMQHKTAYIYTYSVISKSVLLLSEIAAFIGLLLVTRTLLMRRKLSWCWQNVACLQVQKYVNWDIHVV